MVSVVRLNTLAYRGSLDPDHILYELLTGPPNAHRERLKCRRPFVSAAQRLLHHLFELDIRVAQWTDYKWNTEYLINASDLRALPRSSWVRLNRLRTGVGRFQLSMHKWCLAPTPNCECGAAEQTADHIILTCLTHRAPTGIHGLTVLDHNTRC